MRATATASCLRSDDVALLDEIAADRRLTALGLRRLAPTVLASSAVLPEVLDALRAAGYAPLAEGADGTPLLERPTLLRAEAAPTRRRATPAGAGPGAGPGAVSPEADVAGLVRTLLATPDDTPVPTTPVLEPVLRSTPDLTTSEARILAYAVEHRLPVTIDYVNRDGNASRRTIDDIDLSGNSLWAWCRLREDHRWFNLGRVIGVEAVSGL